MAFVVQQPFYLSFPSTPLAGNYGLYPFTEYFSTLVTSFAAIYEAVKKNQFFVLCSPWIVLSAIGHCFIYIQDVLNSDQSKINWNTIFFVLLIIVCWCYDLLRLFFYNEGKTKKQDIAGLKIRLYEEQQPIIQQQINQWQQAFLGFRKQLNTAKVMLEDNSLLGALIKST